MSIAPKPNSLGDLVVGPVDCSSCSAGGGIQIPSPGMDVDIRYIYNSGIKSQSEYGFSRTISANLWLLANSPDEISVIRSDGAAKRYVAMDNGSYVGDSSDNSTLTLDKRGRQWIEETKAGGKMVFPFVPGSAVVKVSYIEDAIGNRHTFDYDGNGLLNSLTDTVGRKIIFRFNPSNLLAEIEDWAGRKTVFQYDTTINSDKCMLTKVVGPTGCQTKYGYNRDGLLTSVVDPNGFETNYTYNDLEKVSSRSVKGIGTTLFDYDFSRIGTDKTYDQTVTDAVGNTVTTTFDSNNQPLTTKRSDGSIVRRRTRSNMMTAATSANANNAPRQIIDDRGNVTVRIGRNGRRTTYTYDKYNNMLTTTTPEGLVTQRVWGFAESPFDKTGSKRRLQAIISPTGVRTTYTYNKLGQRTSESTSMGAIKWFSYDGLGNLTSFKTNRGGEWKFDFDEAGNNKQITDPLGGVFLIVHDARGRMIGRTDPCGNTTRWAYDGNGNRIAEVDPLGNRRSWTYNAFDAVDTFTNPAGHNLTWEYDAIGRNVAKVDAMGNVTRALYNARGRISTIIDALGNKVTYRRDARDRVVAIDRASGARSFRIFTGGRLAATVDPNGNKTAYRYDASGRHTVTEDPAGFKSHYSYDEFGRLSSMTDPLGHQLKLAYDAESRPTSLASGSRVLKSFTYDMWGRISSSSDSSGALMQFCYDYFDRMIEAIDSSGNVTKFNHDPLGRVTATVGPLGNTTATAYDAVGNKISHTDARGQTTTYEYDGNRRRIGVTRPDGTCICFKYDSAGRLTEMSDPLGITRYSYDAVGRRTRTTYADGKSLVYEYDNDGRRSTMRDWAGGKTIYNHDAKGNLVSLTNPFGEKTTMEYDAIGREICRKMANGVTTRRTYDGAGRETVSRQVDASGTILAEFVAEYDAHGNRTLVHEHDGSRLALTYDASGQLIREKRNGTHAYDIDYTYDARGNRLTRSLSGEVTKYEYNAANQLTSIIPIGHPKTKLTYDPNGNLISEETGGQMTTYEWDCENRLVAISGSADKGIKYKYDGGGQRVAAISADAPTLFVHDENNVLAEVTTEGTTSSYYTNLPDRWGGLVSQRRNNESSFYGFDLSSNTRQLSDVSGKLIASYIYDAFGRQLAGPVLPPNPLRFGGGVGYWSDDARQLHVRARRYDADSGRWMSCDPVGFDGSQWNLYQYVGNSPINRIDPSGLDDCLKLRDVPRSVGNKIAECIEKSDDTDKLKECLIESLKDKSCELAAEWYLCKYANGGEDPCDNYEVATYDVPCEACCVYNQAASAMCPTWNMYKDVAGTIKYSAIYASCMCKCESLPSV